MAPNSLACPFIHASMAGSRSTAPLNRSNSVLIVAPFFFHPWKDRKRKSRDLRLRYTLQEKATGLSCPEERKRYFLCDAVAFADSERLVGFVCHPERSEGSAFFPLVTRPCSSHLRET